MFRLGTSGTTFLLRDFRGKKKPSLLGRLVPQAKQIGIAVECFTCYDFQQQCRSVRAAEGVEAVLLYPSLLVGLNH